MGFYSEANMYTNSSCTLYLKSNNYEPIVIPHAFVTHRKAGSFNTKSIRYTETAFAMFNMIDNEFSEGQDYMVEGLCEFKFTNPTDQAIMSKDLKTFNEQYEVYTIMCADKKAFGSSHMRHIELSCK